MQQQQEPKRKRGRPRLNKSTGTPTGTPTVTPNVTPTETPSPMPNSSSTEKRKRGRPRLNKSTGTPTGNPTVTPTVTPTGNPTETPSPMPNSSSMEKRKRGRPRLNKSTVSPTGTPTVTPAETPSPMASSSSMEKQGRESDIIGANFTPLLLTVNAGEDVMMKIMTTYSHLAISILSATGSISTVTLRHSTPFGNTQTYNGLFHILSLTGLFIPNDCGGFPSRAGGISVCLAEQEDGPRRIFGGALSGLFIAASSVHVMLATFNLDPSPLRFITSAQEPPNNSTDDLAESD